MLWETQILPPALRCSATVTQVHPSRLSGHCIKVTEEKGGSEFGYLSQRIPNPCFTLTETGSTKHTHTPIPLHSPHTQSWGSAVTPYEPPPRNSGGSAYIPGGLGCVGGRAHCDGGGGGHMARSPTATAAHTRPSPSESGASQVPRSGPSTRGRVGVGVCSGVLKRWCGPWPHAPPPHFRWG